jgi:hypothetical protein
MHQVPLLSLGFKEGGGNEMPPRRPTQARGAQALKISRQSCINHVSIIRHYSEVYKLWDYKVLNAIAIADHNTFLLIVSVFSKKHFSMVSPAPISLPFPEDPHRRSAKVTKPSRSCFYVLGIAFLIVFPCIKR